MPKRVDNEEEQQELPEKIGRKDIINVLTQATGHYAGNRQDHLLIQKILQYLEDTLPKDAEVKTK